MDGKNDAGSYPDADETAPNAARGGEENLFNLVNPAPPTRKVKMDKELAQNLIDSIQHSLDEAGGASEISVDMTPRAADKFAKAVDGLVATCTRRNENNC